MSSLELREKQQVIDWLNLLPSALVTGIPLHSSLDSPGVVSLAEKGQVSVMQRSGSCGGDLYCFFDTKERRDRFVQLFWGYWVNDHHIVRVFAARNATWLIPEERFGKALHPNLRCWLLPQLNPHSPSFSFAFINQKIHRFPSTTISFNQLPTPLNSTDLASNLDRFPSSSNLPQPPENDSTQRLGHHAQATNPSNPSTPLVGLGITLEPQSTSNPLEECSSDLQKVTLRIAGVESSVTSKFLIDWFSNFLPRKVIKGAGTGDLPILGQWWAWITFVTPQACQDAKEILESQKQNGTLHEGYEVANWNPEGVEDEEKLVKTQLQICCQPLEDIQSCQPLLEHVKERLGFAPSAVQMSLDSKTILLHFDMINEARQVLAFFKDSSFLGRKWSCKYVKKLHDCRRTVCKDRIGL